MLIRFYLFFSILSFSRFLLVSVGTVIYSLLPIIFLNFTQLSYFKWKQNRKKCFTGKFEVDVSLFWEVTLGCGGGGHGKIVNIYFSIRPFGWLIGALNGWSVYIWTKFSVLCGNYVGWRCLVYVLVYVNVCILSFTKLMKWYFEPYVITV